MTTHKTGTREEWLAARLDLMQAEKEWTRRGDELARRRQELPWIRVDKDYTFETDEGPASLADLFQGRSQLLIYHFMFGPSYEVGCPVCSSMADGVNGVHPQICLRVWGWPWLAARQAREGATVARRAQSHQRIGPKGQWIGGIR